MMRRLTAAYIIISFLNFGAINAYSKSGHYSCYVESARQRYATAALFALIPVAGSAIAIFATGFIEHGFDWTVGTCGERQ